MPPDLIQAAGDVQLSVVRHRGEIVAVAGAERAYLAPHIAERPAGDPLLRFAAAMCLYARDIAAGHLPDRYDDDAAELYARCVLIPDEPFDPLSHTSDDALAQRFQVPPTRSPPSAQTSHEPPRGAERRVTAPTPVEDDEDGERDDNAGGPDERDS